MEKEINMEERLRDLIGTCFISFTAALPLAKIGGVGKNELRRIRS